MKHDSNCEKCRVDALKERGRSLDGLYLEALRRNDVVEMYRLDQEGSDIVAELKKLGEIPTFLDDEEQICRIEVRKE